VSSLKDYTIEFVKLKLGLHDFNYTVDNSFFDLKENSLVEKGQVNVHLNIDKKERLMNLNFAFEGIIQTECDKCLNVFDLPVQGTESLIVKITEEPKESDSEIIYLGVNDISFNVYDSIYEIICISIPMIKTCADDASGEKQCNPEMLKFLSESNIESPNIETPTDPRWDKLKNITD